MNTAVFAMDVLMIVSGAIFLAAGFLLLSSLNRIKVRILMMAYAATMIFFGLLLLMSGVTDLMYPVTYVSSNPISDMIWLGLTGAMFFILSGYPTACCGEDS